MLDRPQPEDTAAVDVEAVDVDAVDVEAELRPAHEAVLYATSTDNPLLETRLDPLTDSVAEAADITINHVIEDPGSHQSNHGNTGYGEDDDHHDRADLKTRGRSRTRG